MILSVIEELRQLPLREIGQASYRSKTLLLICSTIAVLLLAERLIFEPRRAWIAGQHQKLSQWDQRMADLQAQSKRQAIVEREYRSLIQTPSDLRGDGVLDTDWAKWLEWARQGLKAHGLEGDLDRTATVDDGSTHALAGFEILGLDHAMVLIEAFGPWASLLHWWDGLSDASSPRKIFVHEVIITRGEDPHRMHLRAKVSAWRSATHAFDGDMAAMAVSQALSPVAYPFGLGMDHPMAWRQRPLDQLTLVGVGMSADQSWVWLTDPIGQLHALSLSETLAENRYRLEHISPNQVVWLDLESSKRMNWVVP